MAGPFSGWAISPITFGAHALSTPAQTLPQAPGTAIDLTNCDREPIHVPGSIQPHGFLLGLLADSAGRLVVQTASENAAAYLNRPLAKILGQPLEDVLGFELNVPVWNIPVLEQMAGEYARFIGSVSLPGYDADHAEFQVVAHRVRDLFVLEFERTEHAVRPGDLNGVIATFVASLEQIQDSQKLCELVVEQVRLLTGFDRVMLYRFDEEGHGTVLAEHRNDRLPSYLGLRFPASDIPRQARALYVLNRVRIIPNVEYDPSPLVARAGNAAELDLSLSILRSVSPVHRDYMRNMGTISSMSISIVQEGRLWGLISGHHSEPLTVPYLVRSACDVLSRIVSSQLLAFQRSASMAHAIELKSVHRQLLTYMASGESYIEGLVRHPDELLAVAGARGAALLVDQRCVLLGDAPPEADVLQLAGWLSKRSREDVFATSHLAAEYPEAETLREKASGVLRISLSQLHRMQILWFRPEVVETVHWAGEPEKGVERVAGELKIHPRISFASWKQIVHGHSAPWTEVEIDSVREFRQSVLEIVLRRAEELADMASELELANKELEAFSYSVSHDLRAPFRHISGFAELMLLNEASRLSETGKRHLTTIAQSAQFAGLLVDSLLNFSRITRTRLDLRPLDMNLLADDVWRDVRQQELGGRKVKFTREPLPTVNGDINLMRQVWRNLLSNAAKYTRSREEAEITVSAQEADGEIIFCIADNGVGFDGQFAHKLFGAFQRLHRMEDFEGTGIGLANVRRIVARHGGRTWAEGKEGHGAWFYFSLPALPSDENTG